MSKSVTAILAASSLFLAELGSLSGCTSPASQAKVQIGQPIPEVTAVLSQQQKAVAPVTVFIAVDQTGSMNDARVSFLKPQDLNPLVTTIQSVGGTLAIASICSDSNRPLIRITYPQPPKLTTAAFHNPAKPEEPPKTGNPFKIKQARKEYGELSQVYQKLAAEDRQTLARYNQQIEELQRQNRLSYQKIESQIESLLNHPRNCQATDIQSSVHRANLLFQEPKSDLAKYPRRYALFITDGLDTFSSQPAKLTSDQVLLVNGSQAVGIFQTIPHQSFESPKAALEQLRWLIKHPESAK